MTRSTGTYVYCFIAAARKPSLRGIPKGLPRTGPVRLIAIENGANANGRTSRGPSALRRWLVVADLPLDHYGEAAINRGLSDLEWVGRHALAHEAVVEFFIGAVTLLPMKLFTIFASDERALEDIARQRDRIAGLIARVANHHEWGVRVALAPQSRRGRPARSRSRQLSGAGYLVNKKTQRDEAAELATRARTVVGGLYDDLAEHAAEAKRRAAADLAGAGAPLLLDAAFLVPRARETRFRAAITRRASRLAPEGYRVTLTGPWPPYTFMQD